MTQSDDLNTQYEAIAAELEKPWDEQDSAAFGAALSYLGGIADEGSIEAAEFLGEMHAMEGPRYDAEAAYIWYYIALSQCIAPG